MVVFHGVCLKQVCLSSNEYIVGFFKLDTSFLVCAEFA